MSPGRPISCLIIDDDDRSNHVLGGELRKRPDQFHLDGVHTCYKEGIQRALKVPPAVIFLDVSMPFFTGREMLGVTSGRPTKLIFLAKETSYVHQSVKNSRYDCLLKPIAPVDLRRTLNRLVENHQQPMPMASTPLARNEEFVYGKLALPTSTGYIFVEPNEIMYCQGDEEYTRITTSSGTYLISKHLKYFEARLSNARFFRVHKSYILNLEFIRSMVKTEGGHVLMTNDKLIPIGRSRRKEFSLLMGI
jgi:two-component system LytT family response regulator